MKYEWCLKKLRDYENEITTLDNIMDTLKNVNVFKDKMEREEIVGPMVCDKNIKLDKMKSLSSTKDLDSC